MPMRKPTAGMGTSTLSSTCVAAATTADGGECWTSTAPLAAAAASCGATAKRGELLGSALLLTTTKGGSLRPFAPWPVGEEVAPRPSRGACVWAADSGEGATGVVLRLPLTPAPAPAPAPVPLARLPPLLPLPGVRPRIRSLTSGTTLAGDLKAAVPPTLPPACVTGKCVRVMRPPPLPGCGLGKGGASTLPPATRPSKESAGFPLGSVVLTDRLG